MERLRDWVVSRGGFLDPTVTIRDLQPDDVAKRYRGFFAGPSGLPDNHIFLKLPYASLISADTSRISPLFEEWNCQYGLTSWDSLILALIYEDIHRPSPWDPYLDFLPERLETPLFWPREDRELLKDTAVDVALGLEAIEAGFRDRFLPVMKDYRDLFCCDIVDLHRQYIRFGALVMAYSFTLGESSTDDSDSDIDEDDQVIAIAMVPIADALNHISFATNARLIHDDHEGCVSMQTIRKIDPGEELINTYGDIGNDVLLVRYGFIDAEDNPYTNALVRYSEFTLTVGQQAFRRMTALGHKDYDLADEYFFLRRPTDDEDLLEQIPDCLKTLLICAIISDDELTRIMETGEEIVLHPYSNQMMHLLLKAFTKLPQDGMDTSFLDTLSPGSRLHTIHRIKLETSNILSAWRNALSVNLMKL